MNMVVKSKIGRRRYIVFRIEKGTDITWKDLVYTFNRLLPLQPIDKCEPESNIKNGHLKISPSNNTKNEGNSAGSYTPFLRHRLKYYDGSYGILLCPHWQKTQAIEAITTIKDVGIRKKAVKIVPIGTSGTLKKARKKYLH
jgi:RNase P/RNase MRP subunit POP5